MAGIDYKVDMTQPMSSKGKTPWMTFNGTDMADSQMCIEHLCEKIEGIDTEKDLSEEQKAISRATRIMMEVRHRCTILIKRNSDKKSRHQNEESMERVFSAVKTLHVTPAET